MSPDESEHAHEAAAKPAATDAQTPAEASKSPVAAPANGAKRSVLPNRFVSFARHPLLLALGIVLAVMVVYVGSKALWWALNTVSTDDAYVNSHATFVAARVPGQVTKVLVDDNNRVAKGDLLVQLDKEPYQIQRDLKQAAFELAQADSLATEDEVRGIAAQAHSNRYKLQHAIELVDDQIAQLRAAVAVYESQKATLALAQANLARAEKLFPTGALSKEELDTRVRKLKSVKRT